MAEYLIDLKKVTDALALSRDRVSDFDLVLYALGGFGDEYKPFIQTIIS